MPLANHLALVVTLTCPEQESPCEEAILTCPLGERPWAILSAHEQVKLLCLLEEKPSAILNVAVQESPLLAMLNVLVIWIVHVEAIALWATASACHETSLSPLSHRTWTLSISLETLSGNTSSAAVNALCLLPLIYSHPPDLASHPVFFASPQQRR